MAQGGREPEILCLDLVGKTGEGLEGKQGLVKLEDQNTKLIRQLIEAALSPIQAFATVDLAQRNVQDHHHDEAPQRTHRRKILVTVIVRLRDQLFHDHVDHGPSRKGQCIG